jgi:hypothetical protein
MWPYLAQAGLSQAMVGATGVVLHIPFPASPVPESIIGVLRNLLMASPNPAHRVPVLILTDEANVLHTATTLAPLIVGDAHLLRRITPLGAADPLDAGLPGGYLVQGYAVRVEPQPQLDKAGGREALTRSLAWLARRTALGPRLQVQSSDLSIYFSFSSFFWAGRRTSDVSILFHRRP